MFFSLLAVASSILFLRPPAVSACEGECITEITSAFLTNYSIPVASAFELVAEDFSSRCIPNWNPQSDPALSHFAPFVKAYYDIAYEDLRKTIFPGFFHGKCQQKDPANPDGPAVNPPGCPNPDCPVVCGTPGSMVHFYGKLRSLAFKSVKNSLRAVAKPGSRPYKEVEKKLKAAHRKARRASSNIWPRSARLSASRRMNEKALATKRCNVKDVQRYLVAALEIGCGGTGTGVTNGLPLCSWERQMKEFILTFP